MSGGSSERSLRDLAGFIYSIGLVGLAMLGMGGVVYHCLAPAGLFAPWMGRLWSQHPGFALLISTGLVALGLAARGEFSALRPGSPNDSPLYLFVTLGTFFALRLFVNGAL